MRMNRARNSVRNSRGNGCRGPGNYDSQDAYASFGPLLGGCSESTNLSGRWSNMRPKMRPDLARTHPQLATDWSRRPPLALAGTRFQSRGRGHFIVAEVLSIRWLRVRVPSASLEETLLRSGVFCFVGPATVTVPSGIAMWSAVRIPDSCLLLTRLSIPPRVLPA